MRSFILVNVLSSTELMGMDCFAPSQLPATDADQLWVETDYPCSKNTAAFVNGAWVRKLRQVDQCEQFAMSKHATSQRINGARDEHLHVGRLDL